jgi:glycosyltransferase involved in cell wall biosynthesis
VNAPRATHRIAYLISQYPAFNHTFILREVRSLREKGVEIETMSVLDADRTREQLSPVEREEHDRTFYIKSLPITRILAAQLHVFVRHPLGFLRGLSVAVRLAGFDPRRLAYYLAYFVEAVVAGDRMSALGLTHVHTHFSSTVTLIMTRIFPITVSATFHGSAEFNEPTLFHLEEKVRRARFVVAISNYGRSQLMVATQPDHWRKIDVSPLGIDPDVFTARPVRTQPAPFELLCVGQLAPAKAHTILLEAVDRLVRAGRSVRLTLIGDGAYRPGLEKIVRERKLEQHVVFTGSQPQDVVRAKYLETDIFTLASFKEGVPVVLMEAMACGIPCVATGITGIPELIEHGVSGLLVPPSDVDAFTAAIEHLMDDAALRQRLGTAARERVMSRYDLRVNTDHLREIFLRRLNDRPAASETPA